MSGRGREPDTWTVRGEEAVDGTGLIVRRLVSAGGSVGRVRVLALRMISPPELTEALLAELARQPGATHVVRLPGAAIEPPGDVLMADLAREAVSDVVAALRTIAGSRCAITLETVDTASPRRRTRPSVRPPAAASTRWCGKRSRPAPARRASSRCRSWSC